MMMMMMIMMMMMMMRRTRTRTRKRRRGRRRRKMKKRRRCRILFCEHPWFALNVSIHSDTLLGSGYDAMTRRSLLNIWEGLFRLGNGPIKCQRLANSAYKVTHFWSNAFPKKFYPYDQQNRQVQEMLEYFLILLYSLACIFLV